MAIFLNDTYTEASNTSLGSHTPDVGGTWVQRNVSSGGTTRGATVTGGTGNLNTATGEFLFTNSATPAGTGYAVEGLWTPPGASFFSLIFNWTAEGTFYQAVLNNYGDTVFVERLSSWSGSVLSDVAQTINSATQYKIRAELTAEGSDKRIKVFVDDVEKINFLDTSPLSSVGLVGVRMDNGDCTSITAEDIGGGGGSSVGAGLVQPILLQSRLRGGLVR